MKTALGILFIVLGSFIGKKTTDKYLQAQKYFCALADFNRNLISNLEYKRESVKTLAKKNYGFADFDKTVGSVFGEELFLPKYLDEGEGKILKGIFGRDRKKQRKRREGIFKLFRKRNSKDPGRMCG